MTKKEFIVLMKLITDNWPNKCIKLMILLITVLDNYWINSKLLDNKKNKLWSHKNDTEIAISINIKFYLNRIFKVKESSIDK